MRSRTSEADDSPMNSTITIEDFEEEVGAHSSCDASVVCFDDHSAKSDDASRHLCPDNDVDAYDADDVVDDVDSKVDDTTKPKADAQTASTARLEDAAPEPAFRVMFRDEDVSRRYRQQIKQFLQTLVQSKPSYEEDVTASNLILEVWDTTDSKDSKDQELFISVENNIIPNSDSIKESNDNMCNSLFTVDTQPKFMDDLDIPTYGKKYEDTFEDFKTSKGCGPKMNCFNCMGNHSLRDCQLPRNHANINKNRKEFATKHNGKPNYIRYHLNEEQKFGHMIPGQLSENLRIALGLKNNELPKHIYRMRLLGYPPGWLEEARLQHSGLSLFNSEGVAETNPNNESGMITADINKDQYDIKKIYDFPGFNVPPPPGTADGGCKFWAPQMQSMHSKATMLLHLQGKEADDGYKRKKLKLSTSLADIPKIESCEMDIDDVEENAIENIPVNEFIHFVPPLPKELLLPPPPPPPPLLSSLTSDTVVIEDSDSQSQELPSCESVDTTTPSSRADSPSLFELESMKKRLLVELEESSSQSNHNTSFKNNLNTTISSDASALSESPSPRKSLNHGFTKSIKFGTPILQSSSPYSKLPSSEKFSKNISDVLNFENLPDSTGKYNKMTGVLQKIRNTMAKIHQI